MASYNFKRKVKFYVVIDGLNYQLEINPDLSFSQTFEEKSRKVKTLHAPINMFDRASITEASAANFSFTMPLYTDAMAKPVFQLLLDYANSSEVTIKTADIYVDTGVEIFKLTKSVFERGTFNISKTDVVSVSISGTASRLDRVGSTGSYSIPGTLQPTTASLPYPNYLEMRRLQIFVDGVEQTSVTGVSVEIANEVNWLPNNTLHKSLAVLGPSDTSYPEAFVVSGRTLSGVVQEYLTDENKANLNKWAIDVPLIIRVASSGTWNLSFEIPEVVYTNRLETSDLFLQSYDFRMTGSPSNLSTVVKYI